MCGYKVIKPQPLLTNKKIASSSLVRKLLQKGKLEKANKILNRNWSIAGNVQKGRQLGKKIGFPTANIDIKDYILACPGVYAVKAKVKKNSKYIKGIANAGAISSNSTGSPTIFPPKDSATEDRSSCSS